MKPLKPRAEPIKFRRAHRDHCLQEASSIKPDSLKLYVPLQLTLIYSGATIVRHVSLRRATFLSNEYEVLRQKKFYHYVGDYRAN